MEGIRKICDENDILMICDEVQCGMGRTGTMFAWQGFGVKPDIMAMAKAIGNGIPVGAFAMKEEVAEYFAQTGRSRYYLCRKSSGMCGSSQGH